MKRTMLILLAMALIACGQKTRKETAQAPQPVEISLGDAGTGARKPQPAAVLPVVKNFSVSPQTVTAGQPVTAVVEVTGAAPQQSVTLAWFGPDGWLVSDEQQLLTAATVKFQPRTLTEPGLYHAELRDTQTATPLASTAVTVGS